MIDKGRMDHWQDEVPDAFPHHQRIAMKACKGPGKTAVLAWNFLVTRSDPKVAAPSITADNLPDNLWTEMAKWLTKSAYLQEHFQRSRSRIFAPARPETWWMSARTGDRTAEAAPSSCDGPRDAADLGRHADDRVAVEPRPGPAAADQGRQHPAVMALAARRLDAEVGMVARLEAPRPVPRPPRRPRSSRRRARRPHAAGSRHMAACWRDGAHVSIAGRTEEAFR